MTITVTLEEARLIYKNMRGMFVMPDEQKAVYNFVHRLEHLIFEAENPSQKLTDDKRQLDK